MLGLFRLARRILLIRRAFCLSVCAFVSPPIGEALPANAFHHRIYALLVGDARRRHSRTLSCREVSTGVGEGGAFCEIGRRARQVEGA